MDHTHPSAAGDTAVTHYIVELVIERSPSVQRLPGETNGRGTFVGGICAGQQ
jgi:hypothetical protein